MLLSNILPRISCSDYVAFADRYFSHWGVVYEQRVKARRLANRDRFIPRVAEQLLLCRNFFQIRIDP